MSLGAPSGPCRCGVAGTPASLPHTLTCPGKSREVSHCAPLSPGDLFPIKHLSLCLVTCVSLSLERQSVQVSPWFLLGWFFVIVRVPYVFQILDPHQIDLP